MLIFFFLTSKALSTRNSPPPWSNCQRQVLLWGFEAAKGGHSAQTSRQVEEQELVSPPWQHARPHITRCSTTPGFQEHDSHSPPPLFAWPRTLRLFPVPQGEITAEKGSRFDTIEEIQAESQEVLNTLTLENFQGCMELWKKTLGSLYTCPRGLLRRRRWKLGVRVIHFFSGQIPWTFG
jgi:hypothetical protein